MIGADRGRPNTKEDKKFKALLLIKDDVRSPIHTPAPVDRTGSALGSPWHQPGGELGC
jgi:hypothetical protein